MLLRFRILALVATLLATGVLWWGSAPAIAQDSFLERVLDDDLGLVAYADDLRELTLGDEKWDVWTCDVGGPLSLDSQSIVSFLNEQVTPYFSWLSAGHYLPTFMSAGSVRSSDRDACHSRVERAGGGRNRPVVIIDDLVVRVGGRIFLSGWGTPGAYTRQGTSVRWVSQPLAVVSGGAVEATNGLSEPAVGLVAHEIGHGLAFPHSYGGLVRADQTLGSIAEGDVYEYDNPMDLMSAGDYSGLRRGTIAINRYAAGWIDPEEVIVYETGGQVYELSPLGVEGNQMLVIPAPGGLGVYYTLGARVAKGFDRDIPQEGVEVYLVDQRETACADRNACWGLDRRTQQIMPSVEDTNATFHVLEVGDRVDLGGVPVKIVERAGDRFTVMVGEVEQIPPEPVVPSGVASCAPGEFVGLFCDEDGSVHEANIETLAGWEITLGCEDHRFCPQDLITRNQMAAFLYRAVEFQYGLPQVGVVELADVGADAWYRPFAEWAVLSGVMPLQDGLFNPRQVVTRADMAQMMTAAFPDLIPTFRSDGIFVDTTRLAPSILTAVESLYSAGVILGCSSDPLQFCPDQPVTRAQMASLFVRALTN